jgi:two-component system, NtrC family, response regulator
MAAPAQRRRLLILENDRALRRELETVFSDLDVTGCETSDQTLATVRRTEPDVVLFDLGAAHKPALAAQSLELLRQILNISPDTKIIAMTAHDARELAVAAVGLGAVDFYHKPLDAGVLSIVVRRALRIRELEEENWRLRERTGAMALEGIIGVSDAMRSLCRAVEKVAPTNATVLLLGESGTGKDLLAQEIHARSPRAQKPFVAVNCAALPETLIESELFGYERGAFTGAAQQKKGKFELASGGTLFLDEIGDMNHVTQAKVLRALENRTIERLGGTQSIPVDVRVISATHRSLPEEIRTGKFREDLFYRLRVVTLELPPLRAHKADIPVLAEAFLQMHGARLGRAAHLSREAIAAIERYDWPGNVRELKNALERSMVLARSEEIGVMDLPEEVALGKVIVQKAGANGHDSGLGEKDFREAKRKFEVAYLTKQLIEHRWNVSRTAATIGLHRQSLQEKLRELGIRRPGLDT